MLINCDECGNKVSDRASSCPECGAPVGSEKETYQPPTSAQPPSVDHSSLQFRQSKAERNKSGFPVGLTMICLAMGGAGVFFYKSIGDIGPAEPNSLSKTRGSDAHLQRPAGSMEQDQFISCWNKNSDRLDQLAVQPTSTKGDFFVSRSPGIGLRKV